MQTQTIELSPFQRRVLELPEGVDAFLGGGRGGGKSYCLALLALRHAEQYAGKARILYLRKTYKGLADFELICRELFTTVYGTAVKYNAAEHIWRFPNGAVMELGQLETHSDLAKYQGRSFTLLLADEVGQFSSPDLLDILRSNLRGPKGLPLRMVMAANPGGIGHFWCAKRFVFRAAPWTAFREDKSNRTWAYAPSTFVDNQFIDREAYADQLRSSCPHDPELLKAWFDGDWAIARGAYFASVIDEARNAVDPWRVIPQHHGWPWQTYLAHDFGSSAPSVTYVVALSPGAVGPDGRYYARDSLVLLDEFASAKRDALDQGLGYTVPILAENIKDMCRRWKMSPRGVADDAIFSVHGSAAGSIAQEFMREGIVFRPARKADRITGWNIMRRLLADAGKPDVPGLYIARTCEYFWSTVPFLGRDEKRIEDVDTRGPDHSADAVRYAVLRRSGPEVMQFNMTDGIPREGR